MGLERIVSKRKGLALSQRPLAGLAQVEEPGLRGGEAGGRGRLEQRAVAIAVAGRCLLHWESDYYRE